MRRVKRQAWCRAAAGQADTATVQPVPKSPPAVQTPNDAGKKDLSQVALPVSDESDQLLRIRHSCAHLMAMAMQRMHRGTQVTIGPWTDNGFYYDFDMSNAAPFTEKVLKKVKKEMRRLMRKDLPFVKEEVTAEEARRRITELGEPYKLEILDSILERCSPIGFKQAVSTDRLEVYCTTRPFFRECFTLSVLKFTGIQYA